MSKFIKIHQVRTNLVGYINTDNISSIWNDEEGSEIFFCSSANAVPSITVTETPEQIMELLQD